MVERVCRGIGRGEFCAYGTQQLRLPRIVAITAPDNQGSIAVLEKIGLRFQSMIKLSEHSPELKMYGPPGDRPMDGIPPDFGTSSSP